LAISENYPNGRKVKNVLDGNGDLSQVESKKNANSGYWQYAGGLAYAQSGAVTSLRLGNGRWESTQFNSRLQPTQIALGSTQNSTDLLKLNYSYGTTQNNGNVLSQQITVPTAGSNPGFVASQTYVGVELFSLKTPANADIARDDSRLDRTAKTRLSSNFSLSGFFSRGTTLLFF
jgi:hypothetical protein